MIKISNIEIWGAQPLEPAEFYNQSNSYLTNLRMVKENPKTVLLKSYNTSKHSYYTDYSLNDLNTLREYANQFYIDINNFDISKVKYLCFQNDRVNDKPVINKIKEKLNCKFTNSHIKSDIILVENGYSAIENMYDKIHLIMDKLCDKNFPNSTEYNTYCTIYTEIVDDTYKIYYGNRKNHHTIHELIRVPNENFGAKFITKDNLEKLLRPPVFNINGPQLKEIIKQFISNDKNTVDMAVSLLSKLDTSYDDIIGIVCCIAYSIGIEYDNIIKYNITWNIAKIMDKIGRKNIFKGNTLGILSATREYLNTMSSHKELGLSLFDDHDFINFIINKRHPNIKVTITNG